MPCFPGKRLVAPKRYRGGGQSQTLAPLLKRLAVRHAWAGNRMVKQKRVPNLPDDDRVARRCGHQKLDRDPETLAVRGIVPQAVALRTEKGEAYLSTSWFEYYPGDEASRLKSVVETYRASGIKLGGNTGIALLCVGKILSAGAARSCALRVTHRKSQKDPAYTRVEGLPLDNSDFVLLQMICDQCCERVTLVSEIDAARTGPSQEA